MRLQIVFLFVLALAVSACAKSSVERRYSLQGQVISVTPNHQEATIKHEEITGLMPAMTMPYKVRDAKLLDGIAPGDLITAKLIVVPNDAYLTDVKKVGQAPLETPRPASTDATPSASSASAGFELLKAGD